MEIVEHETYKNLIQEIESLKEVISILLMEKDDLQNSTKTILMATYYSQIGIYELKAVEAQIEMLKYKRMIELFQTGINQNKKLKLEEVEKQLDVELREWSEKIETLKINLKVSNQVLDNLVENNTEVNRLYRKLSKQLHPDLNRNQTSQIENLWIRVQYAYKNLDLKELEIIEAILETSSLNDYENDTLSSLKTKKEGLEVKSKELQLIIEKIQTEFPFTIRESLENPLSILELSREAKSKISEFLEKKIYYKNILKNLLLENFSILGIHPENV